MTEQLSTTRPLTPALDTLASVRNVSKSFGGKIALDQVNLDIHAGEALGLLGPNGAGKSTLISLLTGLRRADAGTVELFGRNPLTPAARLGLGVTPQATAVPQTLKLREAVELVAAHYANPIPTAELLEQFGLTDMRDRQCGALSGGQQRRFLVALALVGRPRLMVLDEPTTGLDVEAREVLWDQLRRYRDGGGTLLITSHYLAEIEALANRIVVIDQGKVIADGTLVDILSYISVRKVSLNTSVDLAQLEAMDDVVSAHRGAGQLATLVSRDADALVRRLVIDDVEFRQLEVHGASLEEAFVALTAKSASGPVQEP